MEIIGDIKTYAWGKLGLESEVAKLAQLNSDFQPDPNTPYSELWMGDHQSGQSKIKSTGEKLGDFISKDPKKLTDGLDKLPFLFKVLSIQKALSIQVHPNKQEAERLHLERPEIYKDPNHKPELAIALTPFLALCGFRPHNEIRKLLKCFKPIVSLIGTDLVENLSNESALKACYVKLMKSEDEVVSKCIQDISENYTRELKEKGLHDIFNRLMQDFPGDVGILSLFFFNIIKLQPGESIFLPANEPHAYLQGDCIECMACSDNVIRAGLTPKYKDVETLLQMLNYNGEEPQKKLFQPIKENDYLDLFVPSVEDFAVGRLHIPKTKNYYKLNADRNGAIILVLKGNRLLKTDKYGLLNLKRGSIIFIPGDSGDFMEFSNLPNSNMEEFIAYIAMKNNFI